MRLSSNNRAVDNAPVMSSAGETDRGNAPSLGAVQDAVSSEVLSAPVSASSRRLSSKHFLSAEVAWNVFRRTRAGFRGFGAHGERSDFKVKVPLSIVRHCKGMGMTRDDRRGGGSDILACARSLVG